MTGRGAIGSRKAVKFPYPASDYQFGGAALRKHWSRLHRGDCEPFPLEAELRELIASHPELEPTLPIRKATAEIAEAWRAFHHGDFAEAIERGTAVGPLGYNVANKAANIYASYLARDRNEAIDLFRDSAARAEELQSIAPKLANAWYFHGQALGRYSQLISIATALAEGLAGTVRSSLERTLKLCPHHADAHIAFGLFHAEIVAKLGSLVASLTYGASRDAAVRHFEKAIELNPDSIIARLEFATALKAMYGSARKAEALRLFRDAAGCVPADAMERLDVERARSEG